MLCLGIEEVIKVTKKEILKDVEFQEIAEVKADSKNRIALGKGVSIKAHFYKIYQNSIGQIVLDPQITIPAHEAWLFKNKEAASLVREGLKDAKHRRLVKVKEDYSKYLDNV
mgnify:CR=1 FL=1